MSKLTRGHRQILRGSSNHSVPYFLNFNGGLLNVNAIVPALIVCLLVLSAFLITGCSNSKGAESKKDNSISSTDVDSKDTGNQENPDENNGEDQDTNSSESSQSQDDLVEQTALDYAKRMNPTLPDLNTVNIKIVGQWACVEVEPLDRSADRARVLLKNNAGDWQVIAFGNVLPEEYPEAPAELFE